jgi:hypothetical protein
MFADIDLASRIDGLAARWTSEAVRSIQYSGSAENAFVREFSGGVAAFVRQGSPINKIIGIGIKQDLDEHILDEVEKLHREQNEPVRVELATLARTEVGRRLTERGYRLLGFENILGCDLNRIALKNTGGIQIDRIGDSRINDWKETTITGFSSPDDSGVVADKHTHGMIRQVIEDSILIPRFDRYLAFIDGKPAGGASMQLDAGVVMMTGATTLSEFRKRGIQNALLARRLFDAREKGAEFAVIVTAPGTTSQANSMKHGFELLYSRAVLALE